MTPPSSTAGSTAAPAARAAPTEPRWSRDRVETEVLGVARWVVIAVVLAVTVLPSVYMLLLSVRPLDAVLQDPGALLPTPDEIDLDTYLSVLTPVADGGQGFLVFLRNSLLVAGGTVVLTLMVAVPGAYAVSRLEFFGRRQVSTLFLATYLFPGILLAIPLFVVFTRIGLRGSLVGLLLVYVAQVVPVTVYLLRNYFDTVPRSLEEAATMDGASRLGVLRRISLPLAVPAIASNALYVFMIAWNEFLFALLFLVADRDSWTVSLGLSQLADSVEVSTTVLMAGSVLLTIPVVVLFLVAERLLTEGLTAGAEKG